MDDELTQEQAVYMINKSIDEQYKFLDLTKRQRELLAMSLMDILAKETTIRREAMNFIEQKGW